jgi:hypothetical protein
VSGRLINGYSVNDWTLGLLYRVHRWEGQAHSAYLLLCLLSLDTCCVWKLLQRASLCGMHDADMLLNEMVHFVSRAAQQSRHAFESPQNALGQADYAFLCAYTIVCVLSAWVPGVIL